MVLLLCLFFFTGIFSLIIAVNNKTGNRIIILLLIWIITSIFFYKSLILTFSKNINESVTIKWISLSELNIYFSFILDKFTTFSSFLVTFITSLILTYSLNYMKQDENLNLFLSLMFLFCFSMILGITANGLIILFIGWEGVGIFSYFLINFWNRRTEANKSGIKAILVNRIGDMSFFISIAMVFSLFISFSLTNINTLSLFLTPQNIDITWYIIFLFIVAAITKSAQIILNVWLTDAMEGPTPVSSLLHSATMVGMGYIVLLKLTPLISTSSNLLLLICIIGILTILVASCTGVCVMDTKAILANSTSAQLGYMFAAYGGGLFSTSFIHFSTHAIYKALLFLSLGSIIHLKDKQDMRAIKVLFKNNPLIFSCMFIGCISLIGIPGTIGSYSKEVIIYNLNYINYSYYNIIFGMTLVGIFLTIFYNFQLLINLFFLNMNNIFFFNKIKKIKNHFSILDNIVILILASCCFIGGFIFFPNIFINNNFLNDLYINLNNYQYIEEKSFIFLNPFYKFLPILICLICLWFLTNNVSFKKIWINYIDKNDNPNLPYNLSQYHDKINKTKFLNINNNYFEKHFFNYFKLNYQIENNDFFENKKYCNINNIFSINMFFDKIINNIQKYLNKKIYYGIYNSLSVIFYNILSINFWFSSNKWTWFIFQKSNIFIIFFGALIMVCIGSYYVMLS